MSEKQRGSCPVCGRWIQLKKDGTLRVHFGAKLASWPYGLDWCAGSSEKPRHVSGEAGRAF